MKWASVSEGSGWNKSGNKGGRDIISRVRPWYLEMDLSLHRQHCISRLTGWWWWAMRYASVGRCRCWCSWLLLMTVGGKGISSLITRPFLVGICEIKRIDNFYSWIYYKRSNFDLGFNSLTCKIMTNNIRELVN